MTKEERLNYCKVCKHRKLDFDRGVICSLTGDIPLFESECEKYDVDTEEVERLETQKKEDKSFVSKSELRSDIIFCLIFAYFGARGHGVGLFVICLIIVGLAMLLANFVLKQYENRTNKELSQLVRTLVKYAFAILVPLLIVLMLS